MKNQVWLIACVASDLSTMVLNHYNRWIRVHPNDDHPRAEREINHDGYMPGYTMQVYEKLGSSVGCEEAVCAQ